MSLDNPVSQPQFHDLKERIMDEGLDYFACNEDEVVATIIDTEEVQEVVHDLSKNMLLNKGNPLGQYGKLFNRVKTQFEKIAQREMEKSRDE